MTPIARLPFRVGDGNDEDVVGFNGVNHGIREHTHKAAPHVLLQYPPAFGRGDDFLDGRSNLVSKAFSEVAPALLVETHGLLELQCRLRMELMPHLVSRRSMRR